jgi:hypothetical protein
MHRFPRPNMLTERHLLLPFFDVSRALLAQGLVYNVGHFGPTFARSKGPLTWGQAVASNLRCLARAEGAREVQMGKGGWSCEAGWLAVRCGRQWADALVPGAIILHKKLALERVQNLADGKPPGSTSCE